MANDGGPAFPSDSMRAHDFGISGSTNVGMSLRDYFAAKVMQAFCSDPGWKSDKTATPEFTAKCAYAMADAMLAARDDA